MKVLAVTLTVVSILFTCRFVHPLQDDFRIRITNRTDEAIYNISVTFSDFPILAKFIQPYIGDGEHGEEKEPVLSVSDNMRLMAVRDITENFKLKLEKINKLIEVLNDYSEAELANGLRLAGVNMYDNSTNALKQRVMEKVTSHFAVNLPPYYDYYPLEVSLDTNDTMYSTPSYETVMV